MPVNESVHADYKATLPAWNLCRDSIAGEAAMKGKRVDEHLPCLPGHKVRTDLRDPYVKGAVYFNATGRTYRGLRGLVDRKPADIKIPDSLLEGEDAWVKDVTGDGEDLDAFLRRARDEVLQTGRAGILVDHPSTPTRGMTLRQKEQARLRPRMTLYPAESIRNWWNGGLILQEEVQKGGKDEFEFATETRYRVLDIDGSDEAGKGGYYRQRFFVKRKKGVDGAPKDEWILDESKTVYPEKNGAKLRKIPFYWLGSVDNTSSVDPPPLEDIGRVNRGHFRNSAAYENGLAKCGSASVYITGYDKDEELVTKEDGTLVDSSAQPTFIIGGDVVWTIKNEAAKVGKVSITEEDLNALPPAMDRKEKQMVVLGARLLESETPAESGVAKQRDDQRDSSQLTGIVTTLSAGVTEAVKFAVDWSGADYSEVQIAYNSDFFSTPLTPEAARVVVETWQKGGYAKTDMRRMLRQGEWIADSRTDEDIDEELAAESPTGFSEPLPDDPTPEPAAAEA